MVDHRLDPYLPIKKVIPAGPSFQQNRYNKLKIWCAVSCQRSGTTSRSDHGLSTGQTFSYIPHSNVVFWKCHRMSAVYVARNSSLLNPKRYLTPFMSSFCNSLHSVAAKYYSYVSFQRRLALIGRHDKAEATADHGEPISAGHNPFVDPSQQMGVMVLAAV